MKNRYEETKRTLRKMIQEGTIKILQPQKINNKYACYFCQQTIKEDLISFKEKPTKNFMSIKIVIYFQHRKFIHMMKK